MERVDGIVIGAGVVGLAVARALAQRGLETIVLESERAMRGRHLLYEYCAARGLPHRRCGKLVVATAADQCGTL
jgi:L-2-hydroxyglutarate oxidase LhgO